MNILVGKIGQAINFNIDAINCNIGGKSDVTLTLPVLFRNNPNEKFYLCSRSNFLKLPDNIRKYININENVFDMFDGYNKEWPIYEQPYRYMLQHDIKLDVGIIFHGMSSSTNNINAILKKDGEEYSTLEVLRNYSAPPIYILNRTNIKYVGVANDPKHVIVLAQDLTNLPSIILSQYTDTYDTKHYKHINYEKMIRRSDIEILTTKIKGYYSGIERNVLIGSQLKSVDDIIANKTKKDIYVLHKGAPWDRKKAMLDFIGPRDVEIYGKWDDETYEDTRFKGEIPFKQLHEKLQKYKYTLVVPIKEGWVTAKYVEMIMNGVIPFFHPSYDTQRHIKIPDFLRVSSKLEYYERMNYLEENYGFYKELLQQLLDTITLDDVNGVNINNLLMKASYWATEGTYKIITEPLYEDKMVETKQISLF